MALCGRCIGIYSALAAGLTLLPATESWLHSIQKSLLPILIFCVLVIIMDMLSQWLGFWSGSNPQRFITGVGLGISAAACLIAGKQMRRYSGSDAAAYIPKQRSRPL